MGYLVIAAEFVPLQAHLILRKIKLLIFFTIDCPFFNPLSMTEEKTLLYLTNFQLGLFDIELAAIRYENNPLLVLDIYPAISWLSFQLWVQYTRPGFRY